MVRKGQEVQLLSEAELNIEKPIVTPLLRLKPIGGMDNKFLITTCVNAEPHEDVNDAMWIVTRSLRIAEVQQNYFLKRGDVVKLGRVKLKVKDYVLQDAEKEEDKISAEHFEGPIDISNYDDLAE